MSVEPAVLCCLPNGEAAEPSPKSPTSEAGGEAGEAPSPQAERVKETKNGRRGPRRRLRKTAAGCAHATVSGTQAANPLPRDGKAEVVVPWLPAVEEKNGLQHREEREGNDGKRRRSPSEEAAMPDEDLGGAAAPHSMASEENLRRVEESVREIFRAAGEDVNRPGLRRTPRRFALAWEVFTKGYRANLKGMNLRSAVAVLSEFTLALLSPQYG